MVVLCLCITTLCAFQWLWSLHLSVQHLCPTKCSITYRSWFVQQFCLHCYCSNLCCASILYMHFSLCNKGRIWYLKQEVNIRKTSIAKYCAALCGLLLWLWLCNVSHTLSNHVRSSTLFTLSTKQLYALALCIVLCMLHERQQPQL